MHLISLLIPPTIYIICPYMSVRSYSSKTVLSVLMSYGGVLSPVRDCIELTYILLYTITNTKFHNVYLYHSTHYSRKSNLPRYFLYFKFLFCCPHSIHEVKQIATKLKDILIFKDFPT